jgi:hypothetical protein
MRARKTDFKFEKLDLGIKIGFNDFKLTLINCRQGKMTQSKTVTHFLS